MLLMRNFFVLVLFLTVKASNGSSVIIVGAGASGIAAATRLLKNGVSNVTVLEAQDRIGGRIYSVQLGDGYVDVGAEWCHGEKGNIVYEMVKDLNILRHSRMYFPDFYHFNLRRLDRNFSVSLMDIFHKVMYEYNRTGANLGEYMAKRYHEEIAPWSPDEEKHAVAQQAVHVLEGFEGTFDGSFSWHDVAVNNDYAASEGDMNLNWNGLGYKTILEVLMQKYPDPTNTLPIDDKILPNKEVEQINWSSKPIIVKCTDGTTYSADHVVVTVSLGVLKHQHRSLFKPKLPEEKIRAIKQLGIAAVHKILFHFPRRFWNDTYPGSAVIWNKPIQHKQQWMKSLILIMTMDHSPNVLEGWFYGPNVPYIEQLSDEAVIDGFVYALEYFDVDGSGARPDRVIRNKWYGNRYFRGTYSFDTPHTSQGENSDRLILGKPASNLLFAGEATSPTHFGTVHGAIETGFREADRILQMYNRK